MINALNLRMLCEVFYDFFGVFRVTLNSERQGFKSLKEDKRVERRERGACVAEQDRADVGYKRSSRSRLSKYSAVIGWVRLGELREFSARSPVKFSAFDNYAADCGAVASDEFGG